MNRTTGICLVLLATLQAFPAKAADEDLQFWGDLDIVVPVAKDVSATFELSPRIRESGDQLLTRGLVAYKLSPAISLGGGAAYVVSSGGDEFRPHQELNLTSGAWAFRTRLEERFFEGADRVELRFRQRIQATHRFDMETRLTGSGEFLYIFRSRHSTGDAHVDSYRAKLALQHELSPRFEAGVGYMLMYAPVDGGSDKISHVPQVMLTFRP